MLRQTSLDKINIGVANLEFQPLQQASKFGYLSPKIPSRNIFDLTINKNDSNDLVKRESKNFDDSPVPFTETQKLYHKPDLEVFYKTAIQKRDPHFTKPGTLNVWDMVTLNDTLKKKHEDEDQLHKAHQQRLQMREFYESQMEEK